MANVLEIIGADTVHKKGYTGEGIGVAVFDTGIYPHRDFDHRITGFLDLINGRIAPYDDNGHGTHVAGIIGGTQMVAPGCNLIAVKMLDQKGAGNTRKVIQGIEWLVHNKEKYGIRLLNFSMGMGQQAGNEDKKRIIDAVSYAWDQGIIVVCAAGNNGPGRNSVSVPGSCRKIITVGSYDDEKISAGMKADYSGRGPTDSCIRKPEIVAPGSNIRSCSNKMNEYSVKSGTSMATPFVTGAIAVLLEKYPSLTPAQVKLSNAI